MTKKSTDAVIDTHADFAVYVEADMPQQIELKFVTNGFKGGNHSHGCDTALEITWAGGSHLVEVDVSQGEGYPGRVTLTALGDWELAGLVRALVELGDKLRPFAEQMKRDERERA